MSSTASACGSLGLTTRKNFVTCGPSTAETVEIVGVRGSEAQVNVSEGQLPPTALLIDTMTDMTDRDLGVSLMGNVADEQQLRGDDDDEGLSNEVVRTIVRTYSLLLRDEGGQPPLSKEELRAVVRNFAHLPSAMKAVNHNSVTKRFAST